MNNFVFFFLIQSNGFNERGIQVYYTYMFDFEPQIKNFQQKIIIHKIDKKFVFLLR